MRDLRHNIRNATATLGQLMKGLPDNTARVLARAEIQRIERALKEFEKRCKCNVEDKEPRSSGVSSETD